MGRMPPGHVALPVAAVLVLAGASAGFWLPLLHAEPVAQPAKSPSATTVQPQIEPEDLVRFGSKQAKARPVGAVRIASYNVENLFDDKDDPALSGQYEDNGQTKADNELRGAAAAIRQIDADVLALQEVESLDAVKWFRDGWLKDLGYQYVASIDAGDERGIEQAVLSRFPISGTRNWLKAPLEGTHPDKAPDAEPGTPMTLHRSPVRVEIALPVEGGGSQPLTLYVVHHKSGAKSAYWREAEAKKVVELLKQDQAENPGVPVAILGDFNATPDQPTFQTYLTGGLIDVFADRVEGDPAWVTHESGRAIDHILANEAFVKHIAAGSHFVMGVPARPAGADWRTTPPPEGYGSDHYPVVVDLSFPGVKGSPSILGDGPARATSKSERSLDNRGVSEGGGG
ncbi:MAG: hypothetical protein GIKADHBN_02051 [Phycisphaerales bacterium]|nr:hypothetical protein [Phycisphaerales bacterium]